MKTKAETWGALRALRETLPTPKQYQALFTIAQLIYKNRTQPTFEEVSEVMQISKVTIWEHVKNLRAKGYLKPARKHFARTLVLSKSGREVLQEQVCPICGSRCKAEQDYLRKEG